MHEREMADLRQEYESAGIDVDDVDPDPYAQFSRWFGEAAAAGIAEPNAMSVATVEPDGAPSVRTMLMKGFDRDGFVFYTNTESRKAEAIDAEPRVSLLFHWQALHRQVRIDGVAEPVSSDEADTYYESRPLEARLGAHASPQSRVIPDRAWLERRLEEARAAYPDARPPRPEHWGGYRVRPVAFEFWQGRPGRLHDRIRYRPLSDGWLVERLAP
jgi:pyridoxamine 5'-phosphate oxidase